MPPARLKEIVPAFRARKRCNLCLSSIAASVDTRHPRDGREVCLLARRQTETADGIVGLPICRAMTLPTTTRTEAKAWSCGAFSAAPVPAPCKGGLLPARGHAWCADQRLL